MIWMWFALPAIVIAAVCVLYFGVPEWTLKRFRRMLRRQSGLRLHSLYAAGTVWPYLDSEGPDGTPIVLLHGFGGSKDDWAAYAKAFKGRFRVIVPDLPGFGESARETDSDYRAGAQARRLAEFLKALDIEKCHLGGNSMGGFIALQCAIDFPERVKTLTLYNNAGIESPRASQLNQQVAEGKNGLSVRCLEDFDRLMAFATAKTPKMPLQFRRVAAAEMAKDADHMDVLFWQVAKDAEENPLNDRLAEVKMPTLIIWGEEDRLLDPSSVDVLRHGIASSEVFVMKDVGHIPMVEAPQKTAARVLEFLTNSK